METNTVQFLERLLKISRVMAENREIDSLLEYAMQSAMELVNAEQGHLILVMYDGSLDFHVSQGSQEEISHSIVDRVIDRQEALRITDALSSDDFMGARSVQDFRLRSIMCVPLISRGKILGVVYVENRSRANIFHEPHLDVLGFFAKQAAVLIENAMLTDNLQKARQQLITAREEERRRIRRELHGELGPSLAALRLELDTTRNLLMTDTQAAVGLLDEMQGEVKDILTGVRRVINELRPPTLDELGLVFAIREYIATCNGAGDMHFAFQVPETLPPLPAAVEVAVYYITQEAITGVIRHASAKYCSIRLDVDRDVILEIEDDGQEGSSDSRTRDGLASMRQRVMELGGTLQIDNQPGRRIKVRLPLPDWRG